jgi:hypothetical protein
MQTLHINPTLPAVETNANALAFAEGYSVGHDPKGRYRERSKYASRYSERYGERYGVGASVPNADPRMPLRANPLPPPQPPGGQGECLPCGPGQTGTPHGRRVYYDNQTYSCAIRPQRCDCHVIGGNTLESTLYPTGVASGAFATVTLDSGDASFFVPYYMHIVALEVGSVANLAVTGTPLLVNMQDSKSGRAPNMRRASETDPSFGVPTLVYGQEKELECVDWNRFASVNNQQLTITFYNPQTVAVHIFVNLWGLAAA